jgi:hypothetical protein
MSDIRRNVTKSLMFLYDGHLAFLEVDDHIQRYQYVRRGATMTRLLQGNCIMGLSYLHKLGQMALAITNVGRC